MHLKKFGITDKSSVLMVGDSLTSDMKGGEDYGIDTCWYNPSLKENKASVKPTYEVKSLFANFRTCRSGGRKGSFIFNRVDIC